MRVFFYDTADKLALGNARRCDTPRRAARDGRRRHAARRRPAGQRRAVRRRAVRPDAAAAACSSTSRAASSSTTTALRDAPASAATSPAPRSTSSRASPRRAGDPFVSEPARAAQRHPHPAHRRLHRGGAGGHRPVRRRQAARLRRPTASTTLTVNLPQVVTEPAAGRAAAAAPAPQRAGRAGHGQRDARRARRQHRGPDPVHPRRARLRGHRRRRRPQPRSCWTSWRACRRPSGCACWPEPPHPHWETANRLRVSTGEVGNLLAVSE